MVRIGVVGVVRVGVRDGGGGGEGAGLEGFVGVAAGCVLEEGAEGGNAACDHYDALFEGGGVEVGDRVVCGEELLVTGRACDDESLGLMLTCEIPIRGKDLVDFDRSPDCCDHG